MSVFPWGNIVDAVTLIPQFAVNEVGGLLQHSNVISAGSRILQ